MAKYYILRARALFYKGSQVPQVRFVSFAPRIYSKLYTRKKSGAETDVTNYAQVLLSCLVALIPL